MPNYSVLAAQMAAAFHMEGQIAKGTGNTIVVPPLSLNIGGIGLHLGHELVLDPLVHNDGTFSAWDFGTDYYVYAVHPDPGTIAPKLLVSKNATVPQGYTADNSRKIGGFHYGQIRTGSAPGAVAQGIVPNSVWDLRHRPTCSPEGMVEVDNIWVDIYLSSDDGQGGIRSAYNATPLTGTEGLNWYSFVERAAKVGKRLLTYAEWIAAAQGSPQGLDGSNTNAWTATTNTGRNPTGLIANATSIYNCRDCVGNVYEWLDEMVVRWDGTTNKWEWRDVMPNQGYGQLYMYTPNALVVMRTGGHWNDGVEAGSRTATLVNVPWYVDSTGGCRAACDPL